MKASIKKTQKRGRSSEEDLENTGAQVDQEEEKPRSASKRLNNSPEDAYLSAEAIRGGVAAPVTTAVMPAPLAAAAEKRSPLRLMTEDVILSILSGVKVRAPGTADTATAASETVAPMPAPVHAAPMPDPVTTDPTGDSIEGKIFSRPGTPSMGVDYSADGTSGYLYVLDDSDEEPTAPTMTSSSQNATKLFEIFQSLGKISDSNLNFIYTNKVINYESGKFTIKEDHDNIFNAILFADMIVGGSLNRKYQNAESLKAELIKFLEKERDKDESKFDIAIKSKIRQCFDNKFSSISSEKLFIQTSPLFTLQTIFMALIGQEKKVTSEIDTMIDDQLSTIDRKTFFDNYIYHIQSEEFCSLYSDLNIKFLAEVLFRKGIVLNYPGSADNFSSFETVYMKKINLVPKKISLGMDSPPANELNFYDVQISPELSRTIEEFSLRQDSSPSHVEFDFLSTALSSAAHIAATIPQAGVGAASGVVREEGPFPAGINHSFGGRVRKS